MSYQAIKESPQGAAVPDDSNEVPLDGRLVADPCTPHDAREVEDSGVTEASDYVNFNKHGVENGTQSKE